MSVNIKYVDISTKIRAMQGKLLKEEDYNNIIEKNDVKDIATYIKEHGFYSKVIDKIDVNDIHRGKFEVVLYEGITDEAIKIAKHLQGKEKEFYRFIFRKLEIEDVKRMLRALESGKSLTSLDRDTFFVSRYSRINFNRSLAARSINELVESFKGTNFYKLLKRALKNDNIIDNFACEMLLDSYYYIHTLEKVREIYSGKNKELLNEFFGLQADFKNIFFIYRAKKYFNINPEIIMRYIIPNYYRVSQETIKKMIEEKNMDNLLNLINKTYYGKIVDFNKNSIELQFLRQFRKIQLKHLISDSDTIAPVVSYFELKEIEVHDIIHIVEGVRYNIIRDEIKSTLVWFDGEGGL